MKNESKIKEGTIVMGPMNLRNMPISPVTPSMACNNPASIRLPWSFNENNANKKFNNDKGALLNLNIHTSYFSHVWIIRTNSSQRVKNLHEFVTDFERICHTRVTYMFHANFICSMNADSSHCSKHP